MCNQMLAVKNNKDKFTHTNLPPTYPAQIQRSNGWMGLVGIEWKKNRQFSLADNSQS